MARFVRIGTVTLMIFLLAALFVKPSICIDKPKNLETDSFEGRVSYLNWVTSKMIVNGVGVMEFYVSREARITKLGNSITLADINILDDVIVKYYEDNSGRNIVMQITVVVV